MSALGDRPFGQTVYDKFTTVNASGVPTTLGNTPSLAYFVDNDTTLYTSGLTLTADYASKTGLNNIACIVTTSCTGMVAGVDVQIIVAAGTVSAVSMIGYVVANFSINKDSALKPATAGRTLLVSSTGGAAIDWANVGNPGSTVNLSATTTNLVNTLTTYTGNTVQTGDSYARIGANGVGLTAVALTATQAFNNTGTWTGNITGNLSGSVGSVTGAVGSVTGAVGSVTGAVGSVTGNVGGNVTGTIGNLAAGAKTDVENAVWDATLASHLAAGSTGEALNAAGGAGDPWITALPGAYGVGSAGYILGTNLNAQVGSRATPIDIVTGGAINTSGGVAEVDAKKMNGTTILGTGTSGDLWRG